jgi:hypothetical protein
MKAGKRHLRRGAVFGSYEVVDPAMVLGECGVDLARR